MKTARIASAQSRNGSSLEKHSLPTMICIAFLFCIAAAITAPAQSVSYSTLASFNGADGDGPLYMALVQGSDDNFYGTTWWGGVNCAPGGCGTVFKVTPGGTLTALYSFCSQPNCADGTGPWSGLVLGNDGNFYGTTGFGGAYCAGCGTVFKITPGGSLTTLYSFSGPDGEAPDSPLVQDSKGNLYGTTNYGGANGDGTVFKLAPSNGGWTESVLYSFCSEGNCADGSSPFVAGLVLATDGRLYGTTTKGGANGSGTVFKINPTAPPGEGMTTLYSFCSEANCADGGAPYGTLVQGLDGNFYGTTTGGGIYGQGTVFKMTPQGAMTTLHSFVGNSTDGGWPAAGLVQGRDGNFYGTAYVGGADNMGTVYRITPTGTETTLHNFDYTGGAWPSGGLAQASNGLFYGTTFYGGADDEGIVFSMLVPPAPCSTCGQ